MFMSATAQASASTTAPDAHRADGDVPSAIGRVLSLVRKLIDYGRQIADTVRISGRPVKLEPMNSYDRRIVHNTLKDDPEVMSFSPNDDARIKRITLQRRRR